MSLELGGLKTSEEPCLLLGMTKGGLCVAPENTPITVCSLFHNDMHYLTLQVFSEFVFAIHPAQTTILQIRG